MRLITNTKCREKDGCIAAAWAGRRIAPLLLFEERDG
jgi:hypothetical protein